jgi:hypothetical protein
MYDAVVAAIDHELRLNAKKTTLVIVTTCEDDSDSLAKFASVERKVGYANLMYCPT